MNDLFQACVNPVGNIVNFGSE